MEITTTPEAKMFSIFGRRGGLCSDSNGNALRNLTAAQVIEFLSDTRWIGCNLDRFLVVNFTTDEQIPGSWFEEVAAA